MNKAFLDYYRCLEEDAEFLLQDGAELSAGSSFFEFGAGRRGYGRSIVPSSSDDSAILPDLSRHVFFKGNSCVIPFDLTEVAENLRQERYVTAGDDASWKRLARKTYYALRPMLPVSIRRHMQAAWLKGWRKVAFPTWPVDRSVDQMFELLMRFRLEGKENNASSQVRIPFIWFWPKGQSSCAIMTHDVETDAGLRFATQLMDINDSFGIKSSFQLIPDARYVVSDSVIALLRERGFEVNVHDLKHDGHLFDDLNRFREAAVQINKFGAQYGSQGFRSAILYRNQSWMHHLEFSYDMSVPNVAHLDPQHGGCCTVMPYFVEDILELPVTTIQDYTLFHVLRTHSIDLWELQIDQIMAHHGLASFIVHPDYLDNEKAVEAYKGLLGYLTRMRGERSLWIALPGEVNRWWRQRSRMRLVQDDTGWRVEGEGADQAVVAYATMREGELRYEFA